MGLAKTQERPADTPFKQQRLEAWQPMLTPKWVIMTFTLIGVIFIPVGLVIASISNSVVEVIQRYDDVCGPPPSECQVTVTIPADMNPPVYFYYQLTNFYQNHRRYVQSRSDNQLRGVGDLSDADLAPCQPELYAANNPSLILYPCGLIANSFFTDQFNATVTSPAGTNNFLSGDDWTQTGIAWSTDVSDKFKKPRRAYTGTTTETPRPGIPNLVQLPPVTDLEFIVWMRTAGMPTFKKLNRLVTVSTIPAGSQVQVSINNQFPVQGFNGQKAIVFTTMSVLGGKNPFLGYAYITVGVICLMLSAAFLAKHYHSPRTLGDMSYFSWNQSTSRRAHVADTNKAAVHPDEEHDQEHEEAGDAGGTITKTTSAADK